MKHIYTTLEKAIVALRSRSRSGGQYEIRQLSRSEWIVCTRGEYPKHKIVAWCVAGEIQWD